MGRLSQAGSIVPKIGLACAFASIVFLACSLTLLANTPEQLRNVPAPGCYCRCAQSRTRAGCTMMCDLPKYLSRWWATSCVKPRVKAPTDTHGASPRLPHPDHAEHAENL